MNNEQLERYGRWMVWYLVSTMFLIGVVSFYLSPREVFVKVGDWLRFPEMTQQVLHHATLLPVNDTLHRLIGVSLLVLGLFQFNPNLRRQRPALHRWSGRVYLTLGLTIITGGLVYAFNDPFSGVGEQVFVVSVAAGQVFMLSRAVLLAMRRDFVHHREWMMRAYAVFLFIAVQRILFIGFTLSTDWPERDIFMFTGWMSVIIMLIAAETWINLSRRPIPAVQGATT